MKHVRLQRQNSHHPGGRQRNLQSVLLHLRHRTHAHRLQQLVTYLRIPPHLHDPARDCCTEATISLTNTDGFTQPVCNHVEPTLHYFDLFVTCQTSEENAIAFAQHQVRAHHDHRQLSSAVRSWSSWPPSMWALPKTPGIVATRIRIGPCDFVRCVFSISTTFFAWVNNVTRRVSVRRT